MDWNFLPNLPAVQYLVTFGCGLGVVLIASEDYRASALSLDSLSTSNLNALDIEMSEDRVKLRPRLMQHSIPDM